MLGDLRRALEGDDELFLHYQPKYTLDGGRIEGVEALLRWQHPLLGLIPPDEFIPVAEGTGIILPLTERVLGMSLTQLRHWSDAGHAVPVAVNLSTRCLLDAGAARPRAATAGRARPGGTAAAGGDGERGHG